VNKKCIVKIISQLSLAQIPDLDSYVIYIYRLVNKSVCIINTHFNHKTNTKYIL